MGGHVTPEIECGTPYSGMLCKQLAHKACMHVLRQCMRCRDHLPDQPSPFRQWFSGAEPSWGEEDPLNRQTVLDKAGSERGESEADPDTDAGSTTLDTPYNSKRRYYYVTVSSQ